MVRAFGKNSRCGDGSDRLGESRCARLILARSRGCKNHHGKNSNKLKSHLKSSPGQV